MSTTTVSSEQSGNDRQDMFIPREDYIQSLYAVTQHWHSDIKFFEEELIFFRLLIDKHLLLLIGPDNIGKTREMVSHVLNLERERALLEEGIALHAQHITDLVENPFVNKQQDYRKEHEKLQLEFAAFVKKYREVKSEVFKLTQHVIHSEKVKRVIDWG